MSQLSFTYRKKRMHFSKTSVAQNSLHLLLFKVSKHVLTFFLFRYLMVMKEFTGTASVRLAELEDLFVDMKARVSYRPGQAN